MAGHVGVVLGRGPAVFLYDSGVCAESLAHPEIALAHKKRCADNSLAHFGPSPLSCPDPATKNLPAFCSS